MAIGIGSAVQRLANPMSRALRELYSIGGKDPKLVADFDGEYYRANGGKTTFSDLITHSRTSNATMTDSDGLIKWAPHNLLTYSEQFDNAAWVKNLATIDVNSTVAPNGAATAETLTATGTNGEARQAVTTSAGDYTLAVWIKRKTGTGDVRIGNFTTGTSVVSVTSDWALFTHDATLTSGSHVFTIRCATSGDEVYIWGAHLYRSDLGGMVNNPDRGDSYVPTTSSAVYFPRRGHHVYNGYEWVNKGILVESDARTNLVTYSDQFNNAAWTKAAPTITADAIASPDGNDNADKLVESSTTAHAVYQVPTVTAVAYTFSVFAKSAERTQVNLDFTGGTNGAYFNLSTGEVISSSGTGLTAAITPMGNDWYRCSITQVQSAGAIYPSVSTSVGGARVYLGDGSSGIYIYGAQLEAGSTPSSYIPTNGSTVTRAAEAVTVPYANLPWPTPTYIGDELVTNGTFDTDTSGWTAGSSALLTHVDNKLVVTNNGVGYGYAYQQITGLTVGKTYLLSWQTPANDSQAEVSVGSIGGGDILVVNDITVRAFTANGTSTYINLWCYTSNATESADFDNISVREINPLSVSIQMDGRMTYADEGNTVEVNLIRWHADFDNRIFSYISTDGANVGKFVVHQEAINITDVVESSDVYAPSILVPFNIASRHGSTFINGAVDGVALTANTTPVALPDLSSTDLDLAYDYNGTIKTFRIWDKDLGDTGIAEATAPSLEPSLSLSFDSTESSFVDKGWSE